MVHATSESERARRLKNLAWFLPLIGGILASAVLVFLPPTETRLWAVRGMLVRAVAIGMLLQTVLAVVLLFCRAWLKTLLSAGAAVVLFFVTVFAMLIGGPAPDFVAQKTADAVGVRHERLVCLGGCLTRESTVVFRLDGEFTPPDGFVPVPDPSDVRGMVTRTLERFGQAMTNAPSCRILKRNLDCSTILAVETPAGWLFVYFGNATL